MREKLLRCVIKKQLCLLCELVWFPKLPKGFPKDASTEGKFLELMSILPYFFSKHVLFTLVGRWKLKLSPGKRENCVWTVENWERSSVNKPYLAGLHLFMSVWDRINSDNHIWILGSTLTCGSQISLWDWRFVFIFCVFGANNLSWKQSYSTASICAFSEEKQN